MAAFKQDFSIVQSSDCKTLTFTDTSNMGVGMNDSNYTYSTFTTKNIGVYDSTNTLIGTLIPIVDATPVTFTLDKDRYLSIVYTLQIGTSTPLTKTYNIALSCNVDLAFGNMLVNDILNENHGESNDDSTLFNIVKTTLASKIFASRNNGTLSQDMLDLANGYIDISLCANLN